MSEEGADAASAGTGVRVERGAQGVVTLVLDRPARHNALDRDDMRALAGAIEGLRDEPEGSLRALVVTGAGREAFCAGGDQRALAPLDRPEDGADIAARMGDAMAALEALPVPVIAAMNGHALGGGAELALACDLRVVGADLRFGLVHRRLGLTPGWGAGQRLLRLVGYARALEILLEAETLGAEDLLRLGLACEIAPAGEALPAARARAARYAAADPATVRDLKALLRDGVERPPADALARERTRFPARWASEAHMTAMRGFKGG